MVRSTTSTLEVGEVNEVNEVEEVEKVNKVDKRHFGIQPGKKTARRKYTKTP